MTVAMDSDADYDFDTMPRPLTHGEIKILIEKCHILYTSTCSYLEEVKTRPEFHYAKIASTTISLATITLHLTWEHTGTFQGVSTVYFWVTLAVWPLGLYRPISAGTSAITGVLKNITYYIGRKSEDCGLTDLIISLIVNLALVAINSLEFVGGCLTVCAVLIGYFGLAVVVAAAYSTLSCSRAFEIFKEAYRRHFIGVNNFHCDFRTGRLSKTSPPLLSKKKREQACRKLVAKRANRRKWQAEAQWAVKLAVKRATFKSHSQHTWDFWTRPRPFVLSTSKRIVGLTISKDDAKSLHDFCPGSRPSIRTNPEPAFDWATLKARVGNVWDFSPRARPCVPTISEETVEQAILEAHVGNAWDFTPRPDPFVLKTPERGGDQTECSIDCGYEFKHVDEETEYSVEFDATTYNASDDTICDARDAEPKYFWTRTCNIGVASTSEISFVLVRRCFDGCGVWVDCINDDLSDKTDSCIVSQDDVFTDTTYDKSHDGPKYFWTRMCNTEGHQHRAADKLSDDTTEVIMIRECLRGCRRWYDARQDPRDKSCDVCEQIESLWKPDDEGDVTFANSDNGESTEETESESDETGSVIMTPLNSNDEDEHEHEHDGDEADDEGADNEETPIDYGSDLDEETLREIYAECGDWFL